MSVPDPTLLVNQTYTVLEDGVLRVTLAAGLLDGASDGDGGTILVVSNTGAARGNVTLQPDGSFTYAPSANFNGQDSFSFFANDGSGPSGLGMATIIVGERGAWHGVLENVAAAGLAAACHLAANT